MNDLPLECLFVWKCRAVAFVVAVIAGAREQETCLVMLLLLITLCVGKQRDHIPPPMFAGPVGGYHATLEANVMNGARVFGNFLDIALDVRAVGDGLAVGPGLVTVAEGIHVRIGADARVAEQIPGSADRRAALQYQIALVGALTAQCMCGADARQACADDKNIQWYRFKCILFLCHCGIPSRG